VDQPTNTNKYLLHVLNEPITRFKIKALKEALNRLVLQVLANAKIRDRLKHQRDFFTQHMKHDSRIGVHANPSSYYPHKFVFGDKDLSFIPPYPSIIYFSSTLLYQQQKKTVAIKETTQRQNIKELK
jgi:hypothetical protein